MGLRIIYGKSGAGKSTYIFEEIANKIKESKDDKIYIMTPEQFSFTAEKKLLEALEDNAVINAEVITFNRMAYRVIQEIGNGNKTNLLASGKSMLIYNILVENQKKLQYIGKSLENIDLIETQFTELKKHGISIEDLKASIDNVDDKYLKAKLKDITYIFEKYCEYIKDKYIDENDVLTILAQNLSKVDIIKGSYIYIDEFVGFTKQEYNIIKELLKQAKEITVTVNTDNFDSTKTPDVDLFYSNKQSAKTIIDMARNIGIENIETIKIENKKNRFKNKELQHIENNLFSTNMKKYEDRIENIELFLAENQYSEIEHVADRIQKLVREDGYLYRDIGIITKNLDVYSSLCKVIFEQYDIPVFIDENNDLTSNILVKYVTSLIEVFMKNWTSESVLSFAKTGLLDIDEDAIYELENYVTRWGIKGNRWNDNNWHYDENDDKDKIEEARKRIIGILNLFKLKVKDNKKVNNITKSIYEFLLEQKIDEKLQQRIDMFYEKGKLELAQEDKKSWDVLIQVLDEIVLVLGDETISFDKYMQLLKIGLNKSKIGKIPSSQDQVILGDVDRSRSHKVKAIFIIGLNDGFFPSINKNEGFLGDKDREKLKTIGIELAKGTTEMIYEDNFNIYKAFTTAEEKLFLSYASSDVEGKTLRQSVMISKIKNIFIQLKTKSDIIKKDTIIYNKNSTFEQLLLNLRKYNSGENIDEIWFEILAYYAQDIEWSKKLKEAIKALEYNNNPDNITKQNIEKLYGENIKTSVSKLEQYSACPFSYYLKYGLKLSDNDKFKIEAVDTGSFMHDIIDNFFTLINEENISIRDLDEDETNKLISQKVDKIVEEKLNLSKNYIFIATQKYKLTAVRLKRAIKKSLKYIVDSLKNSKFDIFANELEFGNKSENPPIVVEIENGKKVELVGKIDRVDIAKTPQGKYIRIIDYKSSIKNLDLNEVVAGLNLQLLTYMDEMCKNDDNSEPAGVLYFNLIDPIIKCARNVNDEKLEEEIRKKFKMQGYILADIDVIKMHDKNLEKGLSKYIPAYIDKDGNVSKSKSNVVSKEEFQILLKYTNKCIKLISNKILNGNIEIKPYYNAKGKKSSCTYCKYKSICQFSPELCKNEYRYIKNIDKNEILEYLKKECD